jgi:hypothetical protein
MEIRRYSLVTLIQLQRYATLCTRYYLRYDIKNGQIKMHQDNTKPDFNFIMDQPGGELPPAKKSKLPLAVGIAAAILIVLVLAMVLIPRVVPKKSVNYTGTVQTHLDLINSGKYDESREMLANKDMVTRENYLLIWRDFLPKNYDLKKCKLDSMNHGTDTVDVYVACPKLESTETAKFRYEFNKGSTAINKIESNNASS